ncbi:MAG: phosphoribosyltransferase family protein [Trueperella sp.]|nr:phosphoribosyltransferase family protein [Trueperella sp.]
MAIAACVSDLANLIFPRACPCGEWDTDLCPDCRSALTVGWRRVDTQAPYLARVGADGELYYPYPTYALAEYLDPAARVIVSWKNQVNAGLEAEIAALWRSELAKAPVSQWFGLAAVTGSENNPVLWVPAPSAASRKRSGRFVAGVLAQQAGQTWGGKYADVLARQSGWFAAIDSRGRPLQLSGRGQKSHRIYPTADLTGKRVIAVDDVVTTGATIAGISRAVNQAGGQLIGAIALAAAPDPRKSSVGNVS